MNVSVCVSASRHVRHAAVDGYHLHRQEHLGEPAEQLGANAVQVAQHEPDEAAAAAAAAAAGNTAGPTESANRLL